MSHCPNCKSEITRTAKFCPDCGTPLQPVPSQRVEKGAIFNGPVSARDINLGPKSRTPGEHIADYVAWLAFTNRDVRLSNIIKAVAQPGAATIPIDRIFVSLDTTFQIPKGETLANFLKTKSRKYYEKAHAEWNVESRPASVWEVATHHSCAVLLGDPGSGKSTIGQFLTLVLAGAKSDASILDRLSRWTHGALLPVPVVLRDFAAWLSADATGDLPKGCSKLFWDFMEESYKTAEKPVEWRKVLSDEILRSGALFILDGWDETAEVERLAVVAETICDLVTNSGTKSRFLLTSRPYAWDGLPVMSDTSAHRVSAALLKLLSTFPDSYKVAALRDEQITTFIEQWYVAVKTLWQLANPEDKRHDMLAAAKRPDLRCVVESPLLLTLTAALSGTRLPDDRVDLYKEIVDLLLARWTEDKKGQRSLQAALGVSLQMAALQEKLAECAYHAHAGGDSESGAADIPEYRLIASLRSLFQNDPGKAEAVVTFIEQRAGLLIGKGLKDGVRQFATPHRTFQEYLAACHLANQPSFNEDAAKIALAAPGHWQEVLAFAGRISGSARGAAAAHSLIKTMSYEERSTSGPVPDAEWRRAVVAGKMILEIGVELVKGSEASSLVWERVRWWLAELLTKSELPATERAAAGIVLGRLGDPRKGVGCKDGVPEFAWSAEFPAGDFTLGDGGKKRRILAPYQMSIYPVTVQQFAEFVREGWAEDKYWSPNGLKHREAKPEDYDRAEFQTPNHPRVGVSWHEAVAFCKWASERMGRLIRLPTEAEWERAAAGDAKARRKFAWGNEEGDELAVRCNMGSTGIGHTSAVGMFPTGNTTPEGIADMTGNVWEWCASRYSDDSKDASKSVGDLKHDFSDTGVVRGGSWGNDYPVDLRASCRYYGRPGYRRNALGFRVVVVGAAC